MSKIQFSKNAKTADFILNSKAALVVIQISEVSECLKSAYYYLLIGQNQVLIIQYKHGQLR